MLLLFHLAYLSFSKKYVPQFEYYSSFDDESWLEQHDLDRLQPSIYGRLFVSKISQTHTLHTASRSQQPSFRMWYLHFPNSVAFTLGSETQDQSMLILYFFTSTK